MSNLPYLQPKQFSFKYKGFTYEVVLCHEYYPDWADADEDNVVSDELDFTGNYVCVILTPDGTKNLDIDKEANAQQDYPWYSDELKNALYESMKQSV